MAAYEGISDVAAVSAIIGLLAFGTMLRAVVWCFTRRG